MRRVILLGNSNVGKTTLLKNILPDNAELQHPGNTACARFYYYATGDSQAQIEICDTAGMERYHSLASVFSREAAAGIIVFDLADPSSFDDVERWRELLLEGALPGVVWVLVGNKSDLPQTVDALRLKDFVESAGVQFYRVSAKTGQGVHELFDDVAKMAEGVEIPIRPVGLEGNVAEEELNVQSSWCCW